MGKEIAMSIDHKELLTSIRNNEFFLVYQPKVNIYNGKLLGLEALVRWKKNNLQTIFPSDFIPILEDSNLIYYIDFYMLEKIVEQLKEWKKECKKIIPVSINICKNTLLKEEFFKVIDKIFYGTDLEQYVEFELTERDILDEEEIYKIAKVGNKLKKRGFKLAIDDYGIGSSNLLLLIRLHVNTVKLDKLLIKDLKKNKRTQIVLRNVIKLFCEDDIKVVVEGVEDKEEVDILKTLGCDTVQGYYFSKPTHIKEIKESYNLNK